MYDRTFLLLLLNNINNGRITNIGIFRCFLRQHDKEKVLQDLNSSFMEKQHIVMPLSVILNAVKNLKQPYNVL